MEWSRRTEVSGSGENSSMDVDNSNESSRPLPKAVIIRQGMHPNPGPGSEGQSRGQRERVLGKEIGIDDAYTREPMSSLVAALRTKRTTDDVIRRTARTRRPQVMRVSGLTRESSRLPGNASKQGAARLASKRSTEVSVRILTA